MPEKKRSRRLRLALALLAIPLLVAVGALIAASDFGSPPLVTDLGVAFPKHGEPLNRRSEDVGGGGVLVLDDVGCLRLGGGGGPEADVSRTQTVPIWPRDFDLALEGGEVLIVDAEGEEVARVGDKVEMNGAPMEAVPPQQELVERCPGEGRISSSWTVSPSLGPMQQPEDGA